MLPDFLRHLSEPKMAVVSQVGSFCLRPQSPGQLEDGD